MRRRFILVPVGILILLLITAILIDGCAHGRARKKGTGTKLLYASEKSIPKWITKIPEEKNFYYFVGSSGDVSTIDKGKKEAVEDALSQVVETIGVKVTTQSTYEERYYAKEYKLNISEKLLQKGEAKLQGAELKEVYYEKYERPDGSIFYRVWVLVKYSKNEILKEQERLKHILELRYGEVKRYEDEAVKSEKIHNYFQAIQYYVDAAVAAIKIEDGDVFFNRDLNKASILISKIYFKKSGENQIAFVGQPLSEPLKLYVYTIDNGKEYPIKNAPVKFLYRVPRNKFVGYKYIVYNKKTDEKGFVYLKLEKVYEVSNNNLVEARLDFSQCLKKLSAIPNEYKSMADQFRTIANSKKIDFIFKSDTKAREIKTSIFIFQVDKNGDLLPKPVVAPVMYNVLYQKHFNVKILDIPPSKVYKKEDSVIWNELIKAAGKSVERIIFGYVKILNYEEISGFYVVQAMATVNLYNKKTGDLIRNWQFERSGTGANKEEARISVFTEIGQSLGEITSRTMP